MKPLLSLRDEMAHNQLQREKFCCSICLDLLKDPVAVPCGHNYCMNCIKSHWDVEDEKRVYSCPQCRQIFRPRPILGKNTMLADLVEDLKKTGLQTAAATKRIERQKDLEVSQQNIQQRIQDREKYVTLLQKEVEAINRSADKAVEDGEKIFTEMTRLMRKRRSDVKQQVRSQQETEVSRVREIQEKMEQEITELKRLSHTQDRNQFLQDHPSLSALSESTQSFNTGTRPFRYFEDVTAALTEVRDKLQDVLRETCTKVLQKVAEVDVLQSQSEPETRLDFLKYSQDITLDPNTAHSLLLLSTGNRKATLVREQQSYFSHPDRFTEWNQVLSRESLTGRCYWEVEWRGGVCLAVTYKNLNSSGGWDKFLFGCNEKSWALNCDTDSYNFWYNNVHTHVSGPWSSRIGVYLDHRAGILSFHSVSETMTLLHRVQTTFTQPLHAGLRFFFSSFDLSDGSTAEFCQLR